DASSDAGTVRIRNAGRRPRAAITFDDAYRGAVTLALPELIARGLPATVFAAPAMLGARGTWWDELAEAGLLTDAVRDAALRDHAGRGAEILRAVARDAEPPSLPESYGIASAAELARACGNAIRVGSHSWSHEYLPALSDAELKDNLARTLEWVGRFDGRTSRCLALPYGGGSPELGRIALRAGHTTVLRIEGGLWKRNAALAWVPRINVPG
ncbi:MAG: polysaccharide deacetylase family protein, partial [Gemmatimonadota bacterium]